MVSWMCCADALGANRHPRPSGPWLAEGRVWRMMPSRRPPKPQPPAPTPPPSANRHPRPSGHANAVALGILDILGILDLPAAASGCHGEANVANNIADAILSRPCTHQRSRVPAAGSSRSRCRNQTPIGFSTSVLTSIDGCRRPSGRARRIAAPRGGTCSMNRRVFDASGAANQISILWTGGSACQLPPRPPCANTH